MAKRQIAAMLAAVIMGMTLLAGCENPMMVDPATKTTTTETKSEVKSETKPEETPNAEPKQEQKTIDTQNTDTPETMAIDGFQYMVKVALTDGTFSLNMPILQSEDMQAVDTVAISGAHGVTTDGELVRDYMGEADFASTQLQKNVDLAVSMMQELDFYQDIQVEEMLVGTDDNGSAYALQQVNYSYVDSDNQKWAELKIFKITHLTDDYYAATDIEFDGYMADEEAEAAFLEACSAYGIEFQFS